MTYGRRKRTAKTSVKNRRRIVRSRPTARAQKRQILSNQNQIASLRRHVSLTKERIRWHCGVTDVGMTSYPFIVPLTSGPSTSNPAVLNDVIGTINPWLITMTAAPQVNNGIRSKVVVNTQWVDMMVTSGSEPAQLNFTAFLVQLDPKNARQVYEETGSMQQLSRGRDFITPLDTLAADSGYGAYLNTDRFKIIKRLEFETAGYSAASNAVGQATGNTGSGTNSWAMKRCQFKVNYGNTLFKSTGDGSTSATLSYSELPSPSKRFIVIFSNNSVLDLEYPKFTMSSLVTGYAAE